MKGLILSFNIEHAEESERRYNEVVSKESRLFGNQILICMEIFKILSFQKWQTKY